MQSKILVIMALVLFSSIGVSAGVRTNVNEVSNLFNTIENRAEIEASLNNNKVQLNAQSTDEVYNTLGLNSEELEGSAGKLDNIEAHNLEHEALTLRSEPNETNQLLNDLHNSSKILQKDRDEVNALATATDKLMNKIYDGKFLKEVGLDCSQTKGNKIQEAEYYLEQEATAQKDTIYNQHFCEAPRNTYSCRDKLVLKCIKFGRKYKGWEPRTKYFAGSEAFYNKWYIRNHWKRSGSSARYGLDPSPHINNSYQLHQKIAEAEGLYQEQVTGGYVGGVTGEYMEIDDNNRETGHSFIQPNWTINYQYRSFEVTCEQWSENWEELCVPQ